MNIFIEHIYNKKRFGLIRKYKYHKFLRQLDKIIPNFGILWQIAYFIQILEVVYMYDNSKDSRLYSSLQYPEGENGFVVHTEECEISVKLYEKTKDIKIETLRTHGNKLTTCINFKEWEDINTENNEHQEQLMIHIMDIIMREVKLLLIEYYNKRRI